MPIKVQCLGCGKNLKGGEDLAGRRVKCPNCNRQIQLPALPTSVTQSTPTQNPSHDGDRIDSASTVTSDPSRPAIQGPAAAVPKKEVIKPTFLLKCDSCKAAFERPSVECAKEKVSDFVFRCSDCDKDIGLKYENLGCVHCWKPFWTPQPCLGTAVQSPHCKMTAALPNEELLTNSKSNEKQFKWAVKRLTSDAAETLDGIDSLIKAMTANSLLASDLCMEYPWALPQTLRAACDKNFQLRRLYDPVGAYCTHVSTIVGGIVACVWILAITVFGFYNFGLMFAIYATLVVPYAVIISILLATVIGGFIAYVVALAILGNHWAAVGALLGPQLVLVALCFATVVVVRYTCKYYLGNYLDNHKMSAIGKTATGSLGISQGADRSFQGRGSKFEPLKAC